ncbi:MULTISPECIES: SH3 domain-containing protein [unclassified Saccharopolyspora]|uniref:SH3 domain-containing protein n=1 Tax=unclassified Saccharopolyspora TaxID=2646250 RepID=UPI001CD5D92F|nr:MULTISPECIES: SH3 domain-containing protein [unclassified Saccharopolyspora]MCA1187742.1 SH3 domain-containing protein [Saccharopolyspora sp. 6T]MCA1191073.1 SH3 domain-containing protein [Saccharopolyspora sp. 6V]MCA1225946.1 SH3 domain-containing protein [Saccharopolyspora sp. 6M]MCA1278665.1 SH3 domain-containing protein [Saccharopolyspora sp. 7B]
MGGPAQIIKVQLGDDMTGTTGKRARMAILTCAVAGTVGLIGSTAQAAAPEEATAPASQAHAYGGWYVAVDDNVNVRSAPSLGAPVTGKLNRGDRVVMPQQGVHGDTFGPVCGHAVPNNVWWPIEYFGGIHYVAAPCLTQGE